MPIFSPGLGLGITLCEAKRVPDEMIYAAARALADQVQPEEFAKGSIYPALSRIQEVSAFIAAKVMEVAFDKGLAGIERPADLYEYARQEMYWPEYESYV